MEVHPSSYPDPVFRALLFGLCVIAENSDPAFVHRMDSIRAISCVLRYNAGPFVTLGGACYDKPIGKCSFNDTTGRVEGCHCLEPAFVAFTQEKTGDISVICTEICDPGTCPKAPKKAGECVPTSLLPACLVTCVNDNDCLDTAFCNPLGDTGICMYHP
ncbi:hypothetical protein FOL47_008084 [Perkinsus chesapeaki]|uniref:Uncharacterized protein n=1 Tax=Perkinsus chesapeaki TaxID=330153 RepID=A0A7J6MUG8_PERCH|nr:hypothetical protein FOL47_008084 [Perkinsus chesapeaki]